jgi:hypothetical protein
MIDNYAVEKFNLAAYRLATGRDGIKARLEAAFVEIVPVRDADVPDELRDEVKWIRATLTARLAERMPDRPLSEFPAAGMHLDSSVKMTLRPMRFANAILIAERIFAVADRLSELKLAEGLERNTAEPSRRSKKPKRSGFFDKDGQPLPVAAGSFTGAADLVGKKRKSQMYPPVSTPQRKSAIWFSFPVCVPVTQLI